jgi:hypothetical protein
VRIADTCVVTPSAAIAMASMTVSKSSAVSTMTWGSTAVEFNAATATKPSANHGTTMRRSDWAGLDESAAPPSSPGDKYAESITRNGASIMTRAILAITAVRDFAADMGFIEGPCHESDLRLVPWLTDELFIVAAPSHFLAKAAKQRKLTADQLREAQWLLREPGSGTREAVEGAIMPHLLDIKSVMVLGSSEAIKYSAAEGLGLSCLSRSVVQDLVNAKRLSVLATRLPRLTRQLSFIHHRNKVLSASLSNFIAHCQGS